MLATVFCWSKISTGASCRACRQAASQQFETHWVVQCSHSLTTNKNARRLPGEISTGWPARDEPFQSYCLRRRLMNQQLTTLASIPSLSCATEVTEYALPHQTKQQIPAPIGQNLVQSLPRTGTTSSPPESPISCVNSTRKLTRLRSNHRREVPTLRGASHPDPYAWSAKRLHRPRK